MVPLTVVPGPDDIVEKGGDVVVDADRVGPDGWTQLPLADDVRVGDHRAGKIASAQAIDRIGVPDAPDIEAVLDPSQEVGKGGGVADLDDHVRGRHCGAGVEATPASKARRAP
jgi:hypothetical protein